MLQHARVLGDVLIVGLNSDASARAVGGQGHPVVPQDERAELLAALAPVDFVIIFNEVSAEHLVDHLRPDVYVTGGHYSDLGQGVDVDGEKIPPEARVVLQYGGEVKIFPNKEGHSTSDLIHKVLTTYGPSD
jgi:rfaE bifunctional protein nucleotidyltransferase chain/domain